MIDLDRLATDRMIETALAEHLGGEEPGIGPEEILAAAETAPAGRVRSLRGFLELAGVAAVLVFALFTLPRLLSPGDAPEGTRPTTLAEVLGAETAKAFREADGGIAKVRVLADAADRLRGKGISRAGSLLIGDAILAAFPWREHYDDTKNQRDLFEIAKLANEHRMTFLGGLFARMAKHPDPYVRLHGVADLGEIGARQFADVAKAARDDPDDRVRYAALATLAEFGAVPDEQLLARALGDPNADVRRNAVEKFGTYRVAEGEVRSLVLSALADPDERVRLAAMDRILRAADATALPHLRERVGKESDRTGDAVLRSAIGFLSMLEGPLRKLDAVECPGKNEGGRDQAAWLRATDRETFATLAKGGLEKRPLDIQFPSEMVLAIFMGRQMNCGGVSAEVYEDDARIYVRYTGEYFQTLDTAEWAKPWSLFVVPASKKPVVFLQNVEGLIGYPPVWKERARLPALE